MICQGQVGKGINGDSLKPSISLCFQFLHFFVCVLFLLSGKAATRIYINIYEWGIFRWTLGIFSRTKQDFVLPIIAVQIKLYSHLTQFDLWGYVTLPGDEATDWVISSCFSIWLFLLVGCQCMVLASPNWAVYSPWRERIIWVNTTSESGLRSK